MIKAKAAYGKSILEALDRGIALLSDSTYLDHCLQAMAMDSGLAPTVVAPLNKLSPIIHD